MPDQPTTPCDQSGRCPVCESTVGDSTGGTCKACGFGSWFTWEDLGAAQVFRPKGDLLHAEPMQAFLQAFTPRPEARFVVDLSEVQYVSSAALSKLLALRKRLLGVKGRIVLRHVHPDLWEVFRVTRLDTYFEVED